jgi:hypothetical protein
MKSIPSGAGNLKMKGKKVCGMKCGCCTAVNFKDEVTEKFEDEEIKEYKAAKEQDEHKWT